MKRSDLRWIAVGIGFCPFWWQFGDTSPAWSNRQRMWALGPLRFSVRWR